MRVRITRNFIVAGGAHKAGEVVITTKKRGEAWIKAELAMLDKSMDGAKKTKAVT